MRKKLIAGLVTVVSATLCGLAVSACTAPSHSYSDDWKNDASNHWHGCADEGCDSVSDKAAHIYGSPEVITEAKCDAEGESKYTCGICGYEKLQVEAKKPHNWDDGEVTKNPTAEEAGVKTYTCDDCHTTKTEPIDKLQGNPTGYKFTVYGADGVTPLQGATVEIDGVKVISDADGVAEFAGIERGEYTLDVYMDGYVYVDGVKTDGSYEHSVCLAKSASGNVFGMAENGSVKYAAEIDWENDPEMAGRIQPKEQTYTLKNTGSVAAAFTVSLESSLASAGYPYIPAHSVGMFEGKGPADVGYAPVTVVLEPNETFKFNLTANYELFDSQDKDAYPVVYGVTVTRAAAPEKGSSTIYMYDAAIGSPNTVTAAANVPVYFKVDTTAAQYTGGDFTVTFDGSDMSVRNLGRNVAGTSSPLTNGQKVTLDDYYASVFMVTSVSGQISFSVDVSFEAGTVNNPVNILKGQNYTAQIVNLDNKREKWYTITNDTADDNIYTFAPDETAGADTCVTVYGANGGVKVNSTAGQSVWFTVPAGETWKIEVSHLNNSGTVSFVVRDYDSEKDVGGTIYSNPITVTPNGGAQTGVIVGDAFNRYFTFKTTVPGVYTVTYSVSDTDNMNFWITDRFVVNSREGEKLSDFAFDVDNKLYLEEETVCIIVQGGFDSSVTYGYSFNVTCVPLAEKEHTVTVTGASVSGLTVNVKKNGETVASGVTNASGVATMTFMPGIYDVEVTGFDAEAYGYNAVKTQFAIDGNNTVVNLSALVTYKFTVKNPEGTPQSGLTVTLTDGESTIASGTTDSDGVFTTAKIVAGSYKISISGIAASTNCYYKGGQTTASDTETELTLSAINVVKHPSSTEISEIEEGKNIIQNVSAMPTKINYIFTAQTSGTYTITLTATGNYGVYNLYFADTADADKQIIATGAVKSDLDASLAGIVSVDEAKKTTNGYTCITVTLEAGQSVVMGIKTAGTSGSSAKATVDVEKI